MKKTIKSAFKRIMEITPYKPGETSAFKSLQSIKLSSNENPFGCSDNVKKVLSERLESLHRYPDGNCTELRKKISLQTGLDEQKIIFGAGSDEIITMLCMAFAAGENSEVLYSEHGFLMYPIAAKSVGAKPIQAKEKSLRADIDSFIALVNENTKIIFIANPNNPTGSYINQEEIETLVSSIPSDVVIVLDSAYHEYAAAFSDYPDHISFADQYDNVVVLRTFSKAYGIPNLRLGWAYGSEQIIDILNRVRGPFNVSGLAQLAGIASLEDKSFIIKSVDHNTKALSYMEDEFQSLGLKPYPSIANFILVDFDSKEKAEMVDLSLRKRGITGRMMSAYGLPSCIRFSIGLENENNILLDTLKEIL